MQHRLSTPFATVLAVLAASALCAAAQAQTMYRCGNTYQDRPCDVGQMERLNQQRRATDGESSAAGCDDRSTQMQ